MGFQIALSATDGILLITATIIFLLSFLKLIYNRSKVQTLPPGPWKLPIIGSAHHLLTGSLPPYHALKKLSLRYGPLMHLKLGEVSAVVVSSPQMAKLFMKTRDASFSGRTGNLATDVFTYNKCDIVFSPCNDHWREMRRISALELLSNNRVKSLSSVREDEVSNLVALIRRSVGSPVDLSAQLLTLSSSVTCRAAFSEKFEGHQSSLVSLANEATRLMGGFYLSDFFPSFKFLSVVTGIKSKVLKVRENIDIVLDDIIKKRRENKGLVAKSGKLGNKKEDLLDVLLRLQQENEHNFRMSDNIIKAVVLETFAGGTETSATTMAYAMAELMKHPRILEKAQSEVRQSLDKVKCVKDGDNQGSHYLKLVIAETLRLHPPVPLVPRECTEACEINGYIIPVKTRVLINAWAIGRDPEFWEDAEKFIPERFENKNIDYNGKDFEYIPFGAGRRICPGVSFALATIELVLAQLLYHFNWKLPDGVNPEELDMAEIEGLTMKRKNPLYLIAEINEETVVGG